MQGVPFRQPEAGLPNADLVMTNGMLLTCSRGIADEGIRFVIDQIDFFLTEHGR